MFSHNPIRKFEKIGDWTRGHGFNELDRRMLSSENYVTKVYDAWRKTPYIFDIYLVNTAKSNKTAFREKGSVDSGKIALMGLDIVPQENAITLIYTNNMGLELIPLTPWMLAHRAAHAFRYHNTQSNEPLCPAFKRLTEAIQQHFQDILDLCDAPALYPYDNLYRLRGHSDSKDWVKFKADATKSRYYKYLAFQIGSTAAARDFKFRNHFEFLYDCVAQFILTGKIKLRPLTSRILLGPAPFGKEFVKEIEDDQVMYEINQCIKNLESWLNEQLLPDYLEDSVGRVFLM